MQARGRFEWEGNAGVCVARDSQELKCSFEFGLTQRVMISDLLPMACSSSRPIAKPPICGRCFFQAIYLATRLIGHEAFLPFH
jgi:hypothetical protein